MGQQAKRKATDHVPEKGLDSRGKERGARVGEQEGRDGRAMCCVLSCLAQEQTGRPHNASTRSVVVIFPISLPLRPGQTGTVCNARRWGEREGDTYINLAAANLTCTDVSSMLQDRAQRYYTYTHTIITLDRQRTMRS